ncbi:hypothetical protein R2R70_18590 [Cobetia sp. SIMBA_158]|uniref:hypothetical protein n=1 Tax=Cobetia sp. SIMBA_158 TaxID=3081617 RepID=UPI00398032D3
MPEKILSKASAEDLPATVKITLPEKNEFYMMIYFIGYSILAIGIGIFFFGPDEVTYNVLLGPTFEQILLANGLTVATLGLAICGLAGALKKKSLENYLIATMAKTIDALDFDDEDVPEGYELSMVWLDECTFRVAFVEKDEVLDAMLGSAS